MKWRPWRRDKPERAARIISVKRHRDDRSARIDLLFYRGEIRRFLVVSSRRLRAILKRARLTELRPVPLPANVEQVLLDARAELRTLVRERSTGLNQGAYRGLFEQPKEDHEARKEREPVVVVGRFVAAGRDKRQLRDKKVDSFFVDMEVDELGGRMRRFWGTDLDRAVRESGVQPGDRIRLKQLGAIPIKRATEGSARWSSRGYYNGYEIEIAGSRRAPHAAASLPGVK